MLIRTAELFVLNLQAIPTPGIVFLRVNVGFSHAPRRYYGLAIGLWADKLARLRNGRVNEEAVIGGRVCRINEAEEPSEVLWEHIDAPLCRRYDAFLFCPGGALLLLFSH